MRAAAYLPLEEIAAQKFQNAATVYEVVRILSVTANDIRMNRRLIVLTVKLDA